MDTGRSRDQQSRNHRRLPERESARGRSAASVYPARRSRRSGARHARRPPALLTGLARAAATWLEGFAGPAPRATTRRAPRHAARPARVPLRARLGRYSSQLAAAAGVVIVLLSVYLVRQGLMLPSSVPFGGGAISLAPEAGDTATGGTGSAGDAGLEAEPPAVATGQADQAGSAGQAGQTVPGGQDASAGQASSTSSGAPAATDVPAGPSPGSESVPVMEAEGESQPVVNAEGPASRDEALKALRPPASGKLVRGFGYYWSPVLEDWRYHPGLDLALATGDQVRAALGGMVTSVEGSPLFGWRVEIGHGFGLTTVYAHLGAAVVTVGQVVSAGDPVGTAGQPGTIENDLGVHLHFEIRVNDAAIDPTPYAAP